MFSQSFSREGLDHENGKFLLKTYRLFSPSNITYSHWTHTTDVRCSLTTMRWSWTRRSRETPGTTLYSALRAYCRLDLWLTDQAPIPLQTYIFKTFKLSIAFKLSNTYCHFHLTPVLTTSHHISPHLTTSHHIPVFLFLSYIIFFVSFLWCCRGSTVVLRKSLQKYSITQRQPRTFIHLHWQATPWWPQHHSTTLSRRRRAFLLLWRSWWCALLPILRQQLWTWVCQFLSRFPSGWRYRTYPKYLLTNSYLGSSHLQCGRQVHERHWFDRWQRCLPPGSSCQCEKRRLRLCGWL